MTNAHRKFNFMSSIMVEGSCYDSSDDMKHAVQDFYSSHFSKPEPRREKVDGLVLPSLIDPSRMDIEILLFGEEVYNGLHLCCGNKVPGDRDLVI